MSKVDLGDGPPFPHQPGDATASASELARSAGRIRELTGILNKQQGSVLGNLGGELTPPATSVLRPPTQDADDASRASLFAAGALGIYESARMKYNRSIDRINEQWSEYSDTIYVPGGASPEQAAAVQESVNAKKAELRGLQRQAEARLDTSADTVKSLLDRGPDAMTDPAVATAINRSLRGLPDAGGPMRDSLRIMTFNIGGGFKNGWRDGKGFDQGDLPDLAKRILEGDPDVANLQEIFHGDAEALEEELEEQSGDEWTIAFSPASTKVQAGSGFFSDGSDSFGNAIAVRAPSTGDPGATGVQMIDATRKELSDSSFWGMGGGKGGDGRSMAAVTVETATGERVTVSTAHTDFTEVSAEEQARQLREVRRHTEDFAEESGGDHTVITGDLNQVMDPNHDGTGIRDENAPYYDVLESWEDDYDNAGDSADATLKNGNEIDYIWTDESLDHGDAEIVHGDRTDIPGRDDNMSDHQGIVVDVDIPHIDDATGNDPAPERPPSGPGASLDDDYWWYH